MKGPTAKCSWCGQRAYLKRDGTIGQHPVHHYPSPNDGDRGWVMTSDGNGRVRVEAPPLRCHCVCIGTGRRPA